jgi:predicted amidophosphoribosyltransferase
LGLLDLIFPPRCGGCGSHGAVWCAACAASLRPVPPSTLRGIPLIAAGRLEGPLQHAIHTYKYRQRPGLAADLAAPLGQATARAGVLLQALTFVPLHPARQRQRGFNQAELLARQLAGVLHLPLVGGLSRLRETPAQVGLSQPERRVNLIGAFGWSAPRPAPPGLGLVDDVSTSGATLEAAAEAILAAGGTIGAFLVLAVPPGHEQGTGLPLPQTLPGPVVTFPGQAACPNSRMGDWL